MSEAIHGNIQTVQGLIEPSKLGVTLTHEHLLIDLSTLPRVDATIALERPSEASAKKSYEEPVSAENLGFIRYHGMPNADDTRLLDVETAIEEVGLYHQFGGDTLVDATSIGLARDPIGLLRISRATGVNVIMGASFYVDAAHPPGMDTRTEEEIAEQIVRDVTEGVSDTGIRAGLIGEVGCSWPLSDNERKVLRASAQAQRITGAPILVHPGQDETSPLRIIEILAQAGADLTRTIIGHLDRTVFSRQTLKQIGDNGCYLEWDLFGKEQSYYRWNPNVEMPNDAERMDIIAWAISQGYGDKVLIAHDLGEKHRLIKYGGHGYIYILNQIVPRMRRRGFTEESIQKILVDNPAAVLAFAKPTG